jgi:modulator of FtsH protease
MTFAYSAAQWANFFVAEVSASAALVGLLFVAVSINLAKITQFPSLPGRAFEALIVLVMVLFVATFALVPGQSTTALGVEVSCTAIAGWATTVFIQFGAPREAAAPRSWMLSRIAIHRAITTPATGTTAAPERPCTH